MMVCLFLLEFVHYYGYVVPQNRPRRFVYIEALCFVYTLESQRARWPWSINRLQWNVCIIYVRFICIVFPQNIHTHSHLLQCCFFSYIKILSAISNIKAPLLYCILCILCTHTMYTTHSTVTEWRRNFQFRVYIALQLGSFYDTLTMNKKMRRLSSITGWIFHRTSMCRH